MLGITTRRLLALSLLATVAGCNQTDTNMGVTTDPSGQQQAVQQQTQTAVVQGACPQVYLRDGTAVLRRYAKGAKKDDPQGLAFQATLADTTRRCILSDNALTMTVQVQGRIVAGPAGGAGQQVTVPIRVAASDGKQTLYSELVQYPVNTGAGQFIFTKEGVVIPGGSGGFVQVYVGFDEGPYNTK